MERSKIPMLSRFDAISHIMPYYGQTHWAFLLLSSLCSDTREKLDEFYDEFVNRMGEYWRYLLVYSTNQKSRKFLPNDLFEVNIDCSNEENSQILIKFIGNLKDLKGWYFGEHYMHSKIKIRDPIKVYIKFIKELYAYIDILKSIKVILCKKNIYSSKVQYKSSTLDTNWNHVLLILKRLISACIMLINYSFANCKK